MHGPFYRRVFLAFAVAILFAGKPFSIGQRLRLAAIIVLLDIATISPWQVLLYQNGGFALLSRNAGIGYKDGLTFGIRQGPGPLPMSAGLLDFMERADKTDTVLTTKGFVEFVIAEYRERPEVVVEWFLLKLRRCWYGNFTRRLESVSAAIQVVYVLLAIGGLWILRRTHPAVVLALILLTLYFWAMAAMVNPIMRYLVPAMVLLMVPVAAALLELLRKAAPASVPPLLRDTA
jgi:hypothetical protein